MIVMSEPLSKNMKSIGIALSCI